MLDGVLALGLALGLLAVPLAVFSQSAERVPASRAVRPGAACREREELGANRTGQELSRVVSPELLDGP
jgi:hypothetical protein